MNVTAVTATGTMAAALESHIARSVYRLRDETRLSRAAVSCGTSRAARSDLEPIGGNVARRCQLQVIRLSGRVSNSERVGETDSILAIINTHGLRAVQSTSGCRRRRRRRGARPRPGVM